VYDHYNITLRRDMDTYGKPSSMFFVFTCKKHPDHHPIHVRPRMLSSQGTSNLKSGMETCHKLELDGPADADRPPSIPYSTAAHRTLIALRCARNHRSFNSVQDEDYQAEVEMLRPGTIVPSPNTVSRDIKALYLQMSIFVRSYFAVSIHY